MLKHIILRLCPKIFCTPVVQRQLEINEATIMPRFLRPGLVGWLWLPFRLLAGGGIIVITLQTRLDVHLMLSFFE